MKVDCVLDYNVIAVARAQHVYLLARIQAESAPDAAERRPLNLSVVLDRSGSMQGDKLDYVKQAAQFLVKRLGADDRLSLVSYNESVSVDVQPGPVVHKDRTNQVIGSLRAGGTTNLSGGWLQGCQLVAGEMADGQVNRVLLLTDGLANQGVTEPVRLEAMARQKRAEGITTTTMGVGMDFNEDLLTRMASEGGGAFYFIDDPDQAPHIFAEELHDLLSVVGQNLVITISLSPDVRMVRQLNAYPAESGEAQVTFKLGDLFADELKTLLLELSIPALQELGEVEVARLRFDYDELGPDAVAHRTLELPIVVNTVPPERYEKLAPNPDVQQTALLLRAARAREEAIEHADRGEFGSASQVLNAAADAIRESKTSSPELQQQHDMLREEAVDMDLGAERYNTYARKSSRTKSMYTARAARSGDTVALHARLKQSRRASERRGVPPAVIEWHGESMELGDGVCIGRADDNDIVIDLPPVSDHHCEIVRQGENLVLRDLGSTNGTFANGGTVTDDFRLSVGDVVTVGSTLFMFPK
ncbi:MAG: VWA domain-containing protein [Anaerolineae bacterium]|nr:VWA domain-containing protein [Anaerolineae bacterium]